MSLVDEIVVKVRERIEDRKVVASLDEIKGRAADRGPLRSLKSALTGRGFCVMAEHKRLSPTGGRMNDDNLRDCVAEYDARPWVRAISVLTEHDFFDGSLKDLAKIRRKTRKPVLLKDFVVDEYQVWEAKAHGADAVLLMVSLHRDAPDRLRDLYDLATEIGLSTLVEIGWGEPDPEELVEMIPVGAEIVGINCRRFVSTTGFHLRATASQVVRKYFDTDMLAKSRELCKVRHYISKNRVAVAESGLSNAKQLKGIRDAGYHAALIGTAFLKGPASVRSRLDEFEAACQPAKTLQRRKKSVAYRAIDGARI